MLRNVLVFSGSRADLGILLPLVDALHAHDALDVGLLIGDGHTASSEADLASCRAPVVGCVRGEQTSTDPLGVASALGRATVSAAEEISRLAPSIVVVLGDRFEALAVAQAAVVLRVPLAHLHGGEVTGGVIDEPFRHAITKLAQYHFVADEQFRHRVIQLGEHPQRVWTVGSPGIDGLFSIAHIDRSSCCAMLGVDPERPFVIVTYHPLTQHPDEATEVGALVEGLAARPDISVVVTGSNRDSGGATVDRILRRFVDDGPNRRYVESLGRERYVQAVRHALAVVGNSSSGLIDAPALRIPSIDVGDRQRGRPAASSVLRVEARGVAVAAALDEVADPAFRDAHDSDNPYGTPGASRRIADHLATVELSVRKAFHDLQGITAPAESDPAVGRRGIR